MKYAILNTAHEDYNSIVATQKAVFDSEVWSTNYVPILNLDGSQALIQVHWDDPTWDCVLSIWGKEVPDSRTMSEWQEDIN